MSDEWVYVTGKKSFRNQNKGQNLIKNARNPRENILLSTSTVDESIINKNYEKITNQIYHVYNNEKQFLINLIGNLKREIGRKGICVYALGCGTIENQSLVLSKSCIYQLGVCIIVIKLLGAKRVHIYDPVMTKNDYIVWNKLVTQDYEFKDLDVLLKASDYDTVHTEDHNTDCHSDCIEDNKGDATSELEEDSFHTLLWMPHCEKFLYKAVLEGILANKSPLDVSKRTRKLGSDPAGSDFTTADQNLSTSACESEDTSHELPHSDHLKDVFYLTTDSNTSDDKHDFTSHFSIETTTLVGNSISEYIYDDLNFLSGFTLRERALLPFNTHSQSFNDTFITSFKSSTR